jgi:hypothetical protein
MMKGLIKGFCSVSLGAVSNMTLRVYKPQREKFSFFAWVDWILVKSRPW